MTGLGYSLLLSEKHLASKMPFLASCGLKPICLLFTTFQSIFWSSSSLFLGFTVALREKQGETGISHLVWTEVPNYVNISFFEDVYTSYILTQ